MYRNTTALPNLSNGLGIAPTGFFDIMMSMYGRVLQRQALTHMDEHELSDIGVTRAEADREAKKLFWQA